jgi:hypothetical protein
MPIESIEKRPGVLDFSASRPFFAEGFVNIRARSATGPVHCRISVTTLAQMSRSAGDPLQDFERNRPKIESIFTKLYELGLFDEQGGITFSTAVEQQRSND